eukprot:TRINITY_DN2058_c0_g1_i2.p1 TRINITY_DN2058_c0_g1~~TRINITY_DN2058_c0_g1_i2.p1  ORF type:complete len:678 (-),score=68.43 TRINITY_DN2058_c0_g1_i2:33-2018(-)
MHSLFLVALLGNGLVASASAIPPCNLSKQADDMCEDFCNYRCGLYNSSAGDTGRRQNLTLYRLTPTNVTGLQNKNTGDAPGDIGYWLTTKNLTRMCARDPEAHGCIADGSNIYGRFVVEMDGLFGPYMECNPRQHGGTDPVYKPEWKDSRDFVCGQGCLFPTMTGCHDFSPYPAYNATSGAFGAQCHCHSNRRDAITVGRAQPAFLNRESYGVPTAWGPQCQSGYKKPPSGFCVLFKTAGVSRGIMTTPRTPILNGGTSASNGRGFIRKFPSVALRADYVHGQQQQRAVVLLLVGSVCGFFGFLFATIIGINSWSLVSGVGTEEYRLRNFLGVPFESGEPYRPATVSEMVMNRDEPSGKAFFGFCLIGAICILTSWYPWQLRNVYLGDDRQIFRKWCGCRWGPTWLNVRTLCPPVGMLLVACVPTTPPVNKNFGDKLTGAIHILGAVIMIGGYAVCEMKTLLSIEKHKAEDSDSEMEGIYRLSTSDGRQLHARRVFHFQPRERRLRWFLIVMSLVSGVIMQFAGVIASKMAVDSDCWDKYKVPDEHDYQDVLSRAAQPYDLAANTGTFLHAYAVEMTVAMRASHVLLVNTAFGTCKLVKAMEFWFEVSAGIFMILSHLTIWYYCLERHIDLENYLPPMTLAEREHDSDPDDSEDCSPNASP